MCRAAVQACSAGQKAEEGGQGTSIARWGQGTQGTQGKCNCCTHRNTRTARTCSYCDGPPVLLARMLAHSDWNLGSAARYVGSHLFHCISRSCMLSPRGAACSAATAHQSTPRHRFWMQAH